jgi:uncharacterized protein (TIGR02594 family)
MPFQKRSVFTFCLVALAALTTVALAKPVKKATGHRYETREQANRAQARGKRRHVDNHARPPRAKVRVAARRGHRQAPRSPGSDGSPPITSFFPNFARAGSFTDGAHGFVDPAALVAEARRYMGTNPTDRASLWCARFMNFVLNRVGASGTGSDAAKSFASYGRRISGPQVGAIAVLTRGRNGGHVGIVTGMDESGNPIVVSGNHNNTVAEGIYPRERVIAYVLPEGASASAPLPPRSASIAMSALGDAAIRLQSN